MSRPVLALTNAVATVAAFSTAVQLGLLDRIDREPADPEELARTCGANERGVRLLLGALEAGGLVERLQDGRFRPALAGLANLHPMIPLWNRLPEAVRTGVPVPGSYPAAMPTGDTAEAAAAVLPAAERVLAAGPAQWSIAYAVRNPDSRVSAIDLPATRRAVRSAGLGDRFDYLVGTMFSAPLAPAAYDLVLVPHVCHLLEEPATLIRRLVPALAAGGTLAVIEPVPGSPDVAVHELSLYLRTSGGRMRPPESYVDWMWDAGLAGVSAVELPSDPATVVITGRRGPGRHRPEP